MSQRPRRFFIIVVLIACSAGFSASAQDGVTALSALTVRRTEAPLPKGLATSAPDYSPEQISALMCLNRQAGASFGISQDALEQALSATVAAHRTRADAALGGATPQQMLDTELARQRAVQRLARRDGHAFDRVEDYRQAPRGLRVEDVTFEKTHENGREVLIVHALARNLTSTRLELPPVTVRSVDANGYVLASQTSALNELFIEPRASLPLAIRFQNPPAYTASVIAQLGPPFAVRAFRGCDFLAPQAASHPQSLGVVAQAAAKPAPIGGAPDYTPTEIAARELQARADSASAYLRQNSLSCDSPGHRLWRILLSSADLWGEAWVATTAAAEIRRDAAKGVLTAEDVAVAERDRQQAVEAAVNSRPQSSFTPPQYGKVVIEDFQVARRPEFFEVRGKLVNYGNEMVAAPMMRVAGLDRYGHVVSEFFFPASSYPVRLLPTLPVERQFATDAGNKGATPALKFLFNFYTPTELVTQVVVAVACPTE